jgi:hypothetical protein
MQAVTLMVGLLAAGVVGTEAALVVHVPTGPGLTWKEVERLTPGVKLVQYEGTGLWRDADDVIIVYTDDKAPQPFKDRVLLARADYKERIVFVHVKDMESYLELNRRAPRFQIALGRVVAHELEHVRRQTGTHDTTGWFQACLSREDMLEFGWGR